MPLLRDIFRIAVWRFAWLAFVAMFSASVAFAQLPFHPTASSSESEKPAAVVKSLRIYHEKDGVVVEIALTRKLDPQISKLDGPPRLVIDLPNTLVSLDRKRFAFSGGELSAVRLDQFRNAPPVARAVVDLLSPLNYSWDMDQDKLRIHLRAPATSQPEGISAGGQQPAAIPVTPTSSGSLLLAGSRIGGGSSLTAGSDTAILHLARGGEVRVCPGTTVSVTSSQSGHELMLGMSTGAMEAHYTLNASADSILTPDFRLLLAGPGEFDYAMSVDNHGNTCVRALPGNTASVIVSELMGDGTYQVKPDEQIVFRGGRLAAHDTNIPLNCGCPPPRPVVMRASSSAPAVDKAKVPESVSLAAEKTPLKSMESATDETHADTLPTQVEVSIAHPESAPLPESKPNDVHVQVDAPFVFRAREAASIPPAPVEEVAQLPVLQMDSVAPIPAVVLPPPRKKAEHHGFFGKLGGFFAAIFH